MAGFGALAELELNHLHLWFACVGSELVGVEGAVVVAATEVAGGYLPDQVAPVYAVVHGDRTLTRVMRKVAPLGALVERQDGVGTQRSEAHRRDVEHAGRIRLGRVLTNGDAKVMRADFGGRHRVVHPLIAFGMHIQLGAKGPLVRVPLSPLVHQ